VQTRRLFRNAFRFFQVSHVSAAFSSAPEIRNVYTVSPINRNADRHHKGKGPTAFAPSFGLVARGALRKTFFAVSDGSSRGEDFQRNRCFSAAPPPAEYQPTSMTIALFAMPRSGMIKLFARDLPSRRTTKAPTVPAAIFGNGQLYRTWHRKVHRWYFGHLYAGVSIAFPSSGKV